MSLTVVPACERHDRSGQPLGSSRRSPSVGGRRCSNGVVVTEEITAKHTDILNRTKAVGELGAILQRLELGFGVWVFFGDVRLGVTLGHTKIRKEYYNQLALHQGTRSELTWRVVSFTSSLKYSNSILST